MPLGMEVGLGPGDCVGWGPSSPLKRGAHPHQFSEHVCFGKTARWIKMPLGTEIGLIPGVIVLDGDPAPPFFGPCLLWPNGWIYVYCGQTAGRMKMSLGTEVGLGPGNIVLDGGPAPPQWGTPPIFGPCLLWANGRPS